MKQKSNFRLDSLYILLVCLMVVAIMLMASCSTAYEGSKSGRGCYGANKTGERPGGIGKFKG